MNDISIDGKYIGLSLKMKWKGFVEDLQGYTRGFTFICVKDNELYIGHRIPGMKTGLTKIAYADMDEWIAYFDRI